MSPAGRILVICDEHGNGEMVRDLLRAHFEQVHLSCDPSTHAAALDSVRPVVLVLAFAALQASRDFLQQARAADATLARRPHASIVLCDKRDILAAFELCRARCFDDYVLFWPVSHDGARLPMAVLQALRNVQARSGDGAEEVAGPEPRIPAPAPVRNDSSRRSARDAVAEAMRRFLESHKADGEGSFGEGVKPQHAPDVSTSLAQGVQTMVRRREPQTVLFVEDDPDQHAILRLMLAGTGLIAVFAGTAARAMEKLATLLPGIILVDVNLPDGSGVDLIRTIKSDAAFDDVPVITVTGHRTRQVVLGAVAAGAVDFVAKPYGRDMLLAKLKRALGEPATQRTASRASNG